MRRRWTLCLAVSVLAACPLVAQDSIQLRPGDAIRVEFRDDPGLNGNFGIDVNGQVLVPLIGLVDAVDRPFAAVRRELLERLARELVDPVVRIIPLQRVAVLGEVRNPGLFPVDPTHRISDVLAAAGGLTPNARSNRIQLLREGEVVTASLEPQSTALQARIRSGDQIIVARRTWLSQNTPFIIGAISSVVAATIASILVN